MARAKEHVKKRPAGGLVMMRRLEHSENIWHHKVHAIGDALCSLL